MPIPSAPARDTEVLGRVTAALKAALAKKGTITRSTVAAILDLTK